MAQRLARSTARRRLEENTLKIVRSVVSVSMLFVVSVGTSVAQGFPSRPVQFVVPYPPGGGNDIFARVLAGPLQESLGQSVIVDNRAGAGGTIGTAAVARATPDG